MKTRVRMQRAEVRWSPLSWQEKRSCPLAAVCSAFIYSVSKRLITGENPSPLAHLRHFVFWGLVLLSSPVCVIDLQLSRRLGMSQSEGLRVSIPVSTGKKVRESQVWQDSPIEPQFQNSKFLIKCPNTTTLSQE